MFSRFFPCSCVLSVILLLVGCGQLQPIGRVTATSNPQVALYTVNAPNNSTVFVEFGVDTNYGFTTSLQPAPEGGGAVNVLVAGMRGDTLYHMRGIINLSDGSRFADTDQSFIAGALPAALMPNVTVTTAAGMKPQSGIELVNELSSSKPVPVFATDLSGNVIWSYQFQGTSADTIQPIKLLPNGHFAVVITPSSTAPLSPPPPAGTIDVIREIDLAGTIIREISIADLNTKMAAAGYDLTLLTFHHDILPLANDHWIAIANIFKSFTNVSGFPGTTNVLGDVLVDLDENFNPVWVWNEFDHFDVNRHPFMFPDWTHTNALLYSEGDGNLLVSIRNQSWLVKVDYRDGAGTGDVLWRLGYQGDFTLQGGTDPTDWFYAEHAPSFVTASTTGNFSLVLFDNGDDRVFPPNTTCQPVGVPSCPYSTVPILNIDENAKTAALAFNYVTPQYSGFGGNADVLQNGNVEFDECDSTNLVNPDADVYEITQENTPQMVWRMHVGGQTAYRAFRLPSLYPGVQW
jgi:arylsulfate sulfotransferase